MAAARKFSYTFRQNRSRDRTALPRLSVQPVCSGRLRYGAPTGFRSPSASRRITAISRRTGKAYEEGASARGWIQSRAKAKIRRGRNSPPPPNGAPRLPRLRRRPPGSTRWPYPNGDRCRRMARNSTISIWPTRSGEAQPDLFGDYRATSLYPSFQQYSAPHKPPLRDTWGKNEPFFVPGLAAEAFKRGQPACDCALVRHRHSLEKHCREIAQKHSRFYEMILIAARPSASRAIGLAISWRRETR